MRISWDQNRFILPIVRFAHDPKPSCSIGRPNHIVLFRIRVKKAQHRHLASSVAAEERSEAGEVECGFPATVERSHLECDLRSEAEGGLHRCSQGRRNHRFGRVERNRACVTR